MTDRNELIQHYLDQTITSEQLHEFQLLLKSDPTVRRDLLLYSRLDIAIRDYVLFHDYMDDPGVRDHDAKLREPTKSQTAASQTEKTEAEMLNQLLSHIFPNANSEPAL